MTPASPRLRSIRKEKSRLSQFGFVVLSLYADMATYNVKLVSQTNAAVLIVVLLTFFIGGIFLFAPQGIHNNTICILLVVSQFGIAIFLWQKFVIGRTEWMIDDDEIVISWVKKFAFTPGSKITIKWSEVKDIRKGLDPHYYNLKIILVTGQKFKFCHDYTQVKDDFEACLATLYRIFGARLRAPDRDQLTQ